MTKAPKTTQVLDDLFAGKLQPTDYVTGRTLVQAAIYHEGLWYRVTVQTADLAGINALFGEEDRPDNLRDPEFPDRFV